MAVREASSGVRSTLRRPQWLIAEGLAEEQDGRTVHRRGMLAILRRRELLRIAGQLSDELGLPFVEARAGSASKGFAGERSRP